MCINLKFENCLACIYVSLVVRVIFFEDVGLIIYLCFFFNLNRRHTTLSSTFFHREFIEESLEFQASWSETS